MGDTSCHISVLKDEVIDMLQASRGGAFLDCTLGGAGHTRAILESNPSNTVFACDRDERAIARAKENLSEFSSRLNIFHSNFADVKNFVGEQKFDGILLDLGISTDQLKENRGFSFNDEAKLDMRMDEGAGLSAYEVINSWDESRLFKALKEGGVGREARMVTSAILRNRPIETTKELSRVINKAASGISQKKGINPSTVVFQAIRIAVNGEFEELSGFLQDVPSMLRAGGRVACISFHSGEDKIVARTFRDWETGDTAPASWRGVREKDSIGKQISRKAIQASGDEIQRNPSARSARLRVFELLGDVL